MVFINEWLPDPPGIDTKGEFIELFNDGHVPVALRGWSLRTSGKKAFSFGEEDIPGNGYLVLKRTATKLALKNSAEELSLFDASGKLVDHSSFLGQAQPGKSLSRINDATDTSEHFTWSDPTPGAINKISENTEIASNNYPANLILNHPSLGGAEICGIAFGVAIALAGIILFSIKEHEHISELFFGGDEAIR